MVQISPSERLEALLSDGFWQGQKPDGIDDKISVSLIRYSEFLELTHKNGKVSLSNLRKNEDDWRNRSYEFAQALYDILGLVGKTSADAERLARLVAI